jgi:polyferredoxin
MLILSWMSLSAIQRFPKPEFESGYVQPETLLPTPRAQILNIMDVVVLLLTLSTVSWLVIRKRSRKGIFWLSLFSLAYFGFYREGCVCSIGSIQNVTLAFFDPTYTIPITVIAFFILPLLFTLFFGRTFCAGVCPFGALQDLVSFRPQPLDPRLNTSLGIIPYLYLGLAVLFAATGTDFIICRYDPFVGIFRLKATFGMFIFAAILLLSGVFIARPYCRFLCPYGVLLNWISRIARRHITITPSECIQCRLCEESCPYDAIKMPITEKHPLERSVVIRRFLLIFLLIPVLIVTGGLTGSLLHLSLARVNAKVRLAEAVVLQQGDKTQPESFEITAFRSSGTPVNQLFSEARLIIRRFYWGGWFFGGFIGLMIGLKLTGRMIIPTRNKYTPDRGSCLSCVRCVDYCPVKSETDTSR